MTLHEDNWLHSLVLSELLNGLTIVACLKGRATNTAHFTKGHKNHLCQQQSSCINNPPAYLCHQKTHVNVPIKIHVHTVEGYKLSVRKRGAYISSTIPKALPSMAMPAPAMAALCHKPSDRAETVQSRVESCASEPRTLVCGSHISSVVEPPKIAWSLPPPLAL